MTSCAEEIFAMLFGERGVCEDVVLELELKEERDWDMKYNTICSLMHSFPTPYYKLTIPNWGIILPSLHLLM